MGSACANNTPLNRNYEMMFLAKIEELERVIKLNIERANQLENIISTFKDSDSQIMFNTAQIEGGKENAEISSIRVKNVPRCIVITKLTEFRINSPSTPSINRECDIVTFNQQSSNCTMIKEKPTKKYLKQKVIEDDLVKSGAFISFIGDIKEKHIGNC